MSAVASSRIGFAGLTHLGINSAVAAAERGFQVTGFDPNVAVVRALGEGRFPIHEPGLAEAVTRNAARLTFTSDPAALEALDVCYVAPDVPTDDAGQSDLAWLGALIARVDTCLAPDAVMVVLSQVPPGFTRSLSRPVARRYYQVETLVFGQAFQRAVNPERFIVGCDDPARPLPPVYADFLAAFGCPVLPMRYESAELAKIAINMCLVASISTANTLAELCERIGADWAEIVPALRLDRRIGQYAYLTPGLGISGGNLERDLTTVMRIGAAKCTDTGIVAAWVANSRHRRDWALDVLRETVLAEKPTAHLGVLGLAYKQDTASTKNSPALALLAALPDCRFTAYDPMVAADRRWHGALSQAPDALAVCDDADALVVVTPWSEFARLDPKVVAVRLSGRLVVDPYGMLDGAACRAAGLAYYRLGEGRVAGS